MNKNTTTALIIAVLLIGGSFYFVSDSKPVVAEREGSGVAEKVESYEIGGNDLLAKIEDNEDIVLLDVRTLAEYQDIHLESALLVPVEELSGQTLASVGLGDEAKNKEIIIYCRSGNRSKAAYDIMRSLGYTNIKSLAGGISRWEEKAYPYTK